jgi:hypothetical protein
VAPRAGLDSAAKRKKSLPLPGIDPPLSRLLMWKPIRKRSLLCRRRRWKDNIKMDLKEIIVKMGDEWNCIKFVSSGRLRYETG